MRRERHSKLVAKHALRTALALTALVGTLCASVAQASGPTVSQVRSLLERELTPSKIPGITPLLKRGRVAYPFKALEAGTAVIEWFYVPPGARLSKGKVQPEIVASGMATFSAPGMKKMAVVLTTPEGTFVLKGREAVKLTALGGFTTKRGKTISARKAFVVRR